jgi:hypothetical protein
MLGESLRRRQPKRRSSARPEGAGGRGRWKPLLWILPLALVVPFAIGYVLAVYVIFPPEQASGAGIPVPDLVGRSLLEARTDLSVAGLGDVEVTELPHPTEAVGIVIAQSPLAGQQLRPGAGVQVAVSGGRARVQVPDVQGFSAQRAEALLRRSGFQVQAATQESNVPAGRVIGTDPPGGEERILPATVTLLVSSGPAVVQPDTIPPDTLPGPPGGW